MSNMSDDAAHWQSWECHNCRKLIREYPAPDHYYPRPEDEEYNRRLQHPPDVFCQVCCNAAHMGAVLCADFFAKKSPIFRDLTRSQALGYVDMIFTSERPIWEQENRGFGYKPYNPCPVDPAAKAPTAEPATEGQSSILAAAPAPDLAAAPACATLVVKPEKKFELYRFKCEKCGFVALKSDGLKQHIFSKHTPNNQKKW